MQIINDSEIDRFTTRCSCRLDQLIMLQSDLLIKTANDISCLRLGIQYLKNFFELLESRRNKQTAKVLETSANFRSKLLHTKYFLMLHKTT